MKQLELSVELTRLPSEDHFAWQMLDSWKKNLSYLTKYHIIVLVQKMMLAATRNFTKGADSKVDNLSEKLGSPWQISGDLALKELSRGAAFKMTYSKVRRKTQECGWTVMAYWVSDSHCVTED